MSTRTSLNFTRRAWLERWKPIFELLRPTDPTEAPDPSLSAAYIEVLRLQLCDRLKPRYPGDTGRVFCPLPWPWIGDADIGFRMFSPPMELMRPGGTALTPAWRRC